MAEILLTVTVRGKRKTWCFDFYGDPKYLDEWRADGLEVSEVVNTIPAWWVEWGLPVRLWCFCQDVFHFKNPWAK